MEGTRWGTKMRYECGCYEELPSLDGPGCFDPCPAHMPEKEWRCSVCGELCDEYKDVCDRPACLAEACSQGDMEPEQADFDFVG